MVADPALSEQTAALAKANGHPPNAVAAQDGIRPYPLPRLDMASLVRNPPPPLKVRGKLLYDGRMHSVSGPPESGKTVLALWLGLQYMRHGMNVMMLDEETGARQVADLLRCMGADPDLLDRHLYYMYGLDRKWDAEAVDDLGAVCAGFKPALAIFDSMAEMLAAAGLSENDPSDVTRFWRDVLRPLAARYKASVLVVDHDAKEGKQDSRYARGTGAKLAAPDVFLKVNSLRPFSRHQEGLLSLAVSKDRLGDLPDRYYKVRVRNQPLLSLDFQVATASDIQGGEDGSMSPAASKLLSVLTAEPATNQQLVDKIVAKYGHGLRRETTSRALTWLMEANMAERMDLGNGRPALWMKAGDNSMFAPGEEIPPPDAETPPAGAGWPQDSLGSEANGG